MTVSTYLITVTADTEQDARDIAKRRAREDGWRVITVLRIMRVGGDPRRSRGWSLELAVQRAEPQP